MRGLEPRPPLTNHQLEDSCTEFSPALQHACLLACRQVSSFTCPQSASLPLSPSLTAGSNNASAIGGKHGGAGQTYDTRISGRLLCSSDAKLLLLPCRPDRAVPAAVAVSSPLRLLLLQPAATAAAGRAVLAGTWKVPLLSISFLHYRLIPERRTCHRIQHGGCRASVPQQPVSGTGKQFLSNTGYAHVT